MTGVAVSMRVDVSRLASLPRGAGVYILQGEGSLPLYIGKSVDIRARVMSHMRAPEEAHMMAQTQRIDVIETAGEIGALLLESRLIKTQNPLFNQRLRRIRSLCSVQLQITPQGQLPVVVDGKSVNLGTTPGLYGLFSSRHAAVSKLKDLAQQHRLCLAAIGLEKASARGCFGLQIKTCLGACVGQEDRPVHDARLFAALVDSQVEVWPFSGPVDLLETSDGWVQKHRVNHWCYLGTWCSKTGAMLTPVGEQSEGFDLDSYKILVKPIMLKSVKFEEVAL
ncbi:MAG: endonuclease [Betaproteobacteria bacterium]|nr:endonuclease [Betaproteobacteria bacterium]